MARLTNEPSAEEVPHSGTWILIKIIGLMILLPMLIMYAIKILTE